MPFAFPISYFADDTPAVAVDEGGSFWDTIGSIGGTVINEASKVFDAKTVQALISGGLNPTKTVVNEGTSAYKTILDTIGTIKNSASGLANVVTGGLTTYDFITSPVGIILITTVVIGFIVLVVVF